MRFAAIDLGSNTVKLTVADALGDNDWSVVLERAEVTRIGEGLDQSPQLRPEAIERTLRVLTMYAAELDRLGVHAVGCVATAGLRAAADAAAFIERARAETGIAIEIIDGLREAELAYRSPAAAFGPGSLVVVDVGGRSTELVVGHGPTIDARASLEIGGVRLTERFLPTDPPTTSERQALESHIASVLAEAPPKPPDADLVGVSGTVLSLMGIHLGLQAMDRTVRQGEGRRLPTTAIAQAIEDLAKVPAAQRVRGDVIPPGRADVIVAGATILRAICDRYGVSSVLVTHRGVRFGVLSELRGNIL